jgi:hypothetical protein
MKNIKSINIKFSGLLTTLLTILFVGLKLTNHIDWSWWWVLAPIWIPTSLVLLVIIILIILYFIIKN